MIKLPYCRALYLFEQRKFFLVGSGNLLSRRYFFITRCFFRSLFIFLSITLPAEIPSGMTSNMNLVYVVLYMYSKCGAMTKNWFIPYVCT